MNIALFVKNTTLHGKFGGLETQNKILCEGLASRGHSVYVFAPSHSMLEAELKESGVHYVFIKSVFRMGTFIDTLELILARTTKKLLPFLNLSGLLTEKGRSTWEEDSVDTFRLYHKSINFDCVLSQSSAGRGIIKCKESLGVKVITICHGTILGEFKTQLSELNFAKLLFSPREFLLFLRDVFYVLINFFTVQREVINHANKVIAVSTAVKDSLVQETFVDETKIEVIHNGIPAPTRPSHMKTEYTAHKFIYVGRMVKSKGIFTLLDALKYVPEIYLPLIKVDMYGDGTDLPSFQSEILRRGLDGNFVIHGQVPYQQILQLLPEYTVFLFPTQRVEGFPMVLVEAMFSRLAIIACALGGVSDAVTNGENGIVIPSRNAKALAKAMVSCIKDPALVRNLAENGYNRAMRNFTLDTMLNKYLATINKILDNNS